MITAQWISLADAINRTTKQLSISASDAIAQITETCRTGIIKSRGSAPLNASANIELAWRLSQGVRVELLNEDNWFADCDALNNKLGRYRCIELDMANFATWLDAKWHKPKTENPQGAPRGSRIDDKERLEKIGELIKQGLGPTKACDQVASEDPGYSFDATYERLRKKQRNGKQK